MFTASLAPVLGSWGSGCVGDAEPLAVSDLRSGLELRGGLALTPDDHLVELVVHGDHVYAANSNEELGVLRLEPEGGLTVTQPGGMTEDNPRCTSLAVHAASDTLYCAADEALHFPTAGVSIYDISTPGRAELRDRFELSRRSVRDIEVIGDRLLIHHFDQGLWTAAIGPDGGLSTLVDTGVAGNARISAELAGGRIASLFGDVEGTGAQLRLFDLEFNELDRLALDGPPLGLSADFDGDRVAVALGSAGVALVDVGSDSLARGRRLAPPGVATHAIVDGDLAFAITLSGAFAWELGSAGGEPRLFGFGPSGVPGPERAGNMLHGVLADDGSLVTSDWLAVERWAVDRGGEVLDLDVPRGVYVQPEGPVRWRLRNPGPVPLRAQMRLDRHELGSVELGPGELFELELGGERRRELWPADEPVARVYLRVYDASLGEQAEPLSSSVLVLATRPESLEAGVPPATGDPFPELWLSTPALEPFTLPTTTGSQTIWFWPDCALMWPEMEDLAWLARTGADTRPGAPVLISEYNIVEDGFAARWGLEGTVYGHWGTLAPAAVQDANAVYGDDLYAPFFIAELPGDAMPTDYVIDEQGVVRSIERMYRGPFSLRVPWPWDG